jgi:hypothetical protein
MYTRRQNFLSALGVICSLIAIECIRAGTIPAGTPLVVKTLDSIYTKDSVGKQFSAQLDHDLVIGGVVVARAGTRFVGRVETSTKIGPNPLTVNLTGVTIAGKTIPVRTTGAFKPQSIALGPRQTITTRDFVLPHGATLHFRLAQPLNI